MNIICLILRTSRSRLTIIVAQETAGCQQRRLHHRVRDMSSLGSGVQLSLDVVMEDFWTRPTGVYSKPVWLRDDVRHRPSQKPIRMLR